MYVVLVKEDCFEVWRNRCHTCSLIVPWLLGAYICYVHISAEAPGAAVPCACAYKGRRRESIPAILS